MNFEIALFAGDNDEAFRRFEAEVLPSRIIPGRLKALSSESFTQQLRKTSQKPKDQTESSGRTERLHSASFSSYAAPNE